MKTLYLNVYLSCGESAILKMQLIDTDNKNIDYWLVDNGNKYHNRYLPESFRQYAYKTLDEAHSSKPVILDLKPRI